MSGIKIIFPAEYPVVLGGVVANFLLAGLMGPIFVAPARLGTLNKDFLAQFQKEHKEAFPESEVEGMGQPD